MDRNKKTEETDLKAPETKKGLPSAFQNKRLRVIILIAALILLAALVYLVLSLTILRAEPEEELPTIGNHGETMQNGRPFVIEPLEADQILSIRVNNEYGGFYYYKGEDDQYYFEGIESLLYANISDWETSDISNIDDVANSISAVDTLFGLARYMLALTEVEGYDPANLAAYGLANGGGASMTVCHLDENGNEVEETVFFGNLTVTGNGYYVMYEGREAIYVVSEAAVSRCVYTDVTTYLLPLAAPYVSTSESGSVNQLTIKKHGEDFLAMRKLSDEEVDENGGLFSHVLTYPNSYYPSMDNMEPLFSMLSSFTGSSVVEYNISKLLENPEENQEEITELFHKYNLFDAQNRWVYELYYDYEDSGFDTTLYISERLEVSGAAEGEESEYLYYVYSPDFDVIIEFPADSLSWVEWDILSFLDNHSFATSINSVSEMNFVYPGTDITYKITGTDNDLTVTASNGVAVVTDNFRQLYKAVLYTTMDGYADLPEEGSLLLTLTITLQDGTVYRYDFYGMTARKAYYTLNGEGEFYINRDYVKQIIAANNTLMEGGEVIVSHKY